MNYKQSFHERAKVATLFLSKQLPITLEIAKEQALWLKKNTKVKKKK